MPAQFVCSPTLVRVTVLGCALGLLSLPLKGQQPPTQADDLVSSTGVNNPRFTLEIFVRDQHGNILQAPADVRLTFPALNFSATAIAQGASAARFVNLSTGEYELEVSCPGFHKVTEDYLLENNRESSPLYIYLIPEPAKAETGSVSGDNALAQPVRGETQHEDPIPGTEADNREFDLDIFVRDRHGNPLDAPASVRLSSAPMRYDAVLPAHGTAAAHFSRLRLGEYEVEVTCPGYHKVTEPYSSEFSQGKLPVYIYLIPESQSTDPAAPSSKLVLDQHLRGDMQRGMDALNKGRYEAAKKTFTKVLPKAPDNPDVVYFLGMAELGLQHRDVARADFQRALGLDPNNELALVALGELQLQSGSPTDAVISLEKAVSLGRAGWRVDFELASAYFQLQRLGDAESEATRAVHLAKGMGASSLFLLGEIQYAEGKRVEAKHTWESLLTAFPKDPILPETKKMLARAESGSPQSGPSSNAILPPPSAPDKNAAGFVELPWAPPDIDNAVYEVTPQANCNTESILDGALHRMKTELADFEKFTATEHIEHQVIDRYGWPGPVKSHDFSYVVFVYPLGKTSFYLEEYRDGAEGLSGFSDVIISTGLNTLGVNVLQPFYRDRFNYSCEGLANLRGQAAWQIHFEEKRDAKGGGVRTWYQGNTMYDIATKGRLWVASSSFAILRVETELREPVKKLELTRDHLLVDYGPVNFSTGNKQLWLPWSADMYMEVHGKRYHHRHFLSDYRLFDVDTAHKIGAPKPPPMPPVEFIP